MALSYTIIASTTLTSDTTTITFSSIPTTYMHLVLKGYARSSRNAGDDGGYNLTFNNSGSNSYIDSAIEIYSATGVAGYGDTGFTGFANWAGVAQQTAGNSNLFSPMEVVIPNYVTSSRYHPFLMFGVNTKMASPGGVYDEAGGFRLNTDAINRIDIQTNGGSSNFVSGSSFYLYGITSA